MGGGGRVFQRACVFPAEIGVTALGFEVPAGRNRRLRRCHHRTVMGSNLSSVVSEVCARADPFSLSLGFSSVKWE